MTTEQRKQAAFDLVVKYGFCNDCKWILDDNHCHECDCYQSGVKVIREAMFEKNKTTQENDLVHAARGCYCNECFYSEPVEYEDNEGWITHMNEYWCSKHEDTMPLNGFCSEGRKDKVNDSK